MRITRIVPVLALVSLGWLAMKLRRSRVADGTVANQNESDSERVVTRPSPRPTVRSPDDVGAAPRAHRGAGAQSLHAPKNANR
jgi:hypothetical protein